MRPGGPTAKREPSPGGLGLNPEDDPSAVGAALNLRPLAILCHLADRLFGSYSPSALLLCRPHADWLLASALFGGRPGTEERDDLGTNGRAQASASIPTGAGGKRTVVAGHNVVERRRRLRGIDLGLNKPGALSVLLIVECDEPRPKR